MYLELQLTKKIRLNFKGKIHLKGKNSFWWGFPLYKNENNLINIKDYNDISGYFCHVVCEEDKFSITTDILGGYRVYYFEDEESIYFTDDYEILIHEQQQLNNQLSIDHIQLEFWRNHRYTLGDQTFIKEIKKIPPYTTIKVDKKRIKKTPYFRFNLQNKRNSKEHANIVRNSIIKTFSKLQGITNPIILFFSGGNDSVYLATILKNLNIKFKAVFFYIYPEFELNRNDWIRACQVAKNMDIELLVININTEIHKNDIIPIVIKEMLFDRHFSLTHYIGLQELSKITPLNSILINGQGSDSILSFGPSEKGIGSFLKRILLYYPSPINWPLKKIFEYKLNKKFKFPKNELERLIAFCDERNYLFLSSQNGKYYNKILEEYVRSIITNINRKELLCKQMTIKINTFLQGSDNKIVIKSAQHFGFDNIILPFCSPDIIYGTIKYKNNLKELICPKYVLKSNNLRIKKDSIKKDFIKLDSLENSVNILFEKKIETLKDELFIKV